MKKIFLFVVVVTIVIVSGFTYFWYGENERHGTLTEETGFVLAEGESAGTVADHLVTLGAIQNKYIFLAHLKKIGKLNALQVGSYTLYPEDTVTTIADRLIAGKITRKDKKVTFPEGWTTLEMSERLTENGFDGEGFLKLVNEPKPEWNEKYSALASHPKDRSIEGYLFPDTYYFLPNATAEDIVTKMLANFDAKVGATVQKDGAAKGGSFFNTLIIASLVEEEGDNAEDRKMMADVFWKRLAAGQPFQSDVTVNYASGIHKQKLYLNDINIDSPYNTYKNAGLMPTPITNPGLESILAAVYPTANPYYYFITDPKTKKAHFSETFQGHVDNRNETGL